jgi:transcription elongation factor GreA
LLAAQFAASLVTAVRERRAVHAMGRSDSELNETLLTAEGFEKLNAVHVRLRAERAGLIERMRSALEFGGAFPENGDYLEARHELELLDRRLALLDERLFGAKVVKPRPDGEVDLGERVTVLDLESAETTDYRVVGSGESDPPAGEVSSESPIGAALLGGRVGDVVEVDAPGGRRRLAIVELDG